MDFVIFKFNGQPVFFEFKKEYNCSPCIRTGGFNPLMYLVTHAKDLKCDDTNELKTYIETHPDELDKQNDLGYSALMLACKNSDSYSTLKTVQTLIEAGANLNLKDKHGDTALTIICTYFTNYTETIVKALIDAKAKVNLENNRGQTALDICIELDREHKNVNNIISLLKENQTTSEEFDMYI